jgi:polyisoprenoid-binding protein YceI
MKRIHPFFALLPILALWGCSNPADDVPDAKIESPAPAAQGQSDPNGAEASYFTFGPPASTIGFIGSKVTGSHDGGFQNFAGELRIIDGRLANSGNKVVIATGSLWSDNNRVTGHLKSDDFFDVAQFPTAVFYTTSIVQEDGAATVTGNLSLHGITKQISFPAQVELSDDAVRIEAEFSLDRFAYEMKYAGSADNLIRREVVLKLNVAAAPGRADFDAIARAANEQAASPPASGPGGGQRPGFDRAAMMQRFDTNGDGQLDETERAALRGGRGNRPGGRP